MKKKRILFGAITLALVLTLASCSNLIEELRGHPAPPVQEPEPEVLAFTGTPYTEMQTGTDGTLGTSGRYAIFGDWPQTIKAESVTVDETKSVEVGMFTYYKGSDGAWYAKCTENAYGTNYTYSDGTPVAQASANSTKYFKVEPIKWRILTDSYSGKKLLLAENILTANVPYYDYNNVNRSIGDATVYPNNYKESRIRAWLNGLSYTVKASTDAQQTENSEFQGRGFLQTAFTDAIRTKIDTDTTIDNSADSTTDSGSNLTKATTYACADTKDSIFLLSEKEATTSDYGFAAYNQSGVGNARIRMTTDYAKANYAYQNTSAGYGGWWWLRSPYGLNSRYARVVPSNGDANNDYYVDSSSGGVCPALSLKN
ncbi:MAG: hypothetical protein J6S91_07550 [Treponema sp.]|nr:hypothetical protein [Treponema sp.]